MSGFTCCYSEGVLIIVFIHCLHCHLSLLKVRFLWLDTGQAFASVWFKYVVSFDLNREYTVDGSIVHRRAYTRASQLVAHGPELA